VTLTFDLPSSEDDISDFKSALYACDIDETEGEILAKFMSKASSDYKLRNAIEAYNKNKQGKMHNQLYKCALKAHIASIISSDKANIKACASTLVHQYVNYGNITNPAWLLKKAKALVVGFSSSIRMRKKRFHESSLTASFVQQFPLCSASALEYLHFNGKLDLTKEDYEILSTFFIILSERRE
jgi:hypothetical protein